MIKSKTKVKKGREMDKRLKEQVKRIRIRVKRGGI
jgi:hypothetical protein